jgi:hypothetical protein
VWEAIDGDTYGENPITAEVPRLVARYTVRFKLKPMGRQPAKSAVQS